MFRLTLNGKQPRTLREAERDPFDWIEVGRRSAWDRFRLWMARKGWF